MYFKINVLTNIHNIISVKGRYLNLGLYILLLIYWIDNAQYIRNHLQYVHVHVGFWIFDSTIY